MKYNESILGVIGNATNKIDNPKFVHICDFTTNFAELSKACHQFSSKK
jgi:hypothetical protein